MKPETKQAIATFGEKVAELAIEDLVDVILDEAKERIPTQIDDVIIEQLKPSIKEILKEYADQIDGKEG